jgi:hypothetical protein
VLSLKGEIHRQSTATISKKITRNTRPYRAQSRLLTDHNSRPRLSIAGHLPGSDIGVVSRKRRSLI